MRIGGNHLVVHLGVLLILRKKVVIMDDVPDVLQSTTLLTASSSVMQVGTLPQYLDQWKSITFNRFVLNMVKGHYPQLRCHPLLFLNFKQCNIKVALAHHPVTQEVDELLAKRDH